MDGYMKPKTSSVEYGRGFSLHERQLMEQTCHIFLSHSDEVFHDVLGIIYRISNDQPLQVSADDWIALTQLPRPRSTKNIQDLFYHRVAGDENSDRPEEEDHQLNRSDNFLTALTDEEFDSAYKCVLKMREQEFPDINSILKLIKHDCKVMSLVMSHVAR